MLLTDERFIMDSELGSSDQYMAVWSEESERYVFQEGDYIVSFHENEVLIEDKSIALNEERRIIQTTYQTLMSGEKVKSHKLLSDEELSERIEYIEMITPRDDGELWQDKISNPWNWDFVQFIIKHRPDLMI